MKFLIDECLSPKLVDLARENDYGESAHVARIGLAGTKDWDLIHIIADEDWTFVTCNSVDFRGAAGNPGEEGQYTRVTIHAGLVCLNAPDGMTRRIQIELFTEALRELADNPDLVNQVLEISLDNAGGLHVVRYALPAEEV